MQVFDENSAFANGFYNMYEAFLKAVKDFKGCGVYAEKIAKWDKKRLFKAFIDIAEPMPCGFQVLNHGDIWLNNMMFKSDEAGNPLDVSMIDFQGPFWASPVSDLIYFLLSSVEDSLKVKHFDDFIECYHQELKEGLMKLNFEGRIPTLQELHSDMLEKGFFGKLFQR